MEKQDYRFEPLTADNKQTWLEVAKSCSYAPVNALDETFINQQLDNNAAGGNVLIYDKRNGRPVALLPGEIVKRKICLTTFRTLLSRFGGLLVADEHFCRALSIKDFAFKHLVNYYYPHSLKLDSIEVVIPPRIMIEAPSAVYKILPFYWCNVGVNSILYVKIAAEMLERFKPPVRRQIRKGLENLKRTQIVHSQDQGIIEHMISLDGARSAFLKIEPLPKSYFQRLLDSRYYYSLVALLDKQPVACAIYSYCNEVGTYTFNASTEVGKKLYINKALWFTAFEQLRQMGAKYFALGNGIEYSRVHQNVKNVTYFKRNFSTHEAATYRFIHPLTYKAHIAACLSYRQRQRWHADIGGSSAHGWRQERTI